MPKKSYKKKSSSKKYKKSTHKHSSHKHSSHKQSSHKKKSHSSSKIDRIKKELAYEQQLRGDYASRNIPSNKFPSNFNDNFSNFPKIQSNSFFPTYNEPPPVNIVKQSSYIPEQSRIEKFKNEQNYDDIAYEVIKGVKGGGLTDDKGNFVILVLGPRSFVNQYNLLKSTDQLYNFAKNLPSSFANLAVTSSLIEDIKSNRNDNFEFHSGKGRIKQFFQKYNPFSSFLGANYLNSPFIKINFKDGIFNNGGILNFDYNYDDEGDNIA